ncbi:SEC-C metal-binding domain-containing protein [Aquabacterium sp.]
MGRNDPCPCGSTKSFQALLPDIGLLLTAVNAMTTGAIEAAAIYVSFV